MTGQLSLGAISYRNGDNTVLRWALFQVWKQRCYCCREPQIFGNTEIDHIIPRTTEPDELLKLIRDHGLDDDFHLDRPANLALICATCNREKSNRNLLRALVTVNHLVTAKNHAAEVERHYRAYHLAGDVAKGLILASKANPYDRQIHQDFLEYAPAIVRTLGLIDEEKASDFANLRHLQVNGQHVVMGVDPRGRFALRVITDICGDTVEATIESVQAELIGLLDREADEYLRSAWGIGSLTMAKTNALHMHVLDVHRDGPTIAVRFLGGLVHEFDVSPTEPPYLACSHGIFDPPESEYPEKIRAGICFEMTARWDLSTATGDSRTVIIDSFEYDTGEVSPW
ncbi:HNH endonuclease [Micromonospora parva]|uniref:HNH endonuclease signature motif containing protein n=1 Tax=Micromonospora parva TaxID=1464048 RepID=A0ABW6VR61_9ACTN